MNLLNRRGGRLHDVRVDVDVRVHLVLIQTDCSDLYHNRWLKVSMPHIRRSHDNNMQHLNCTSLLWRVLFTSFSPFRVLNSVSSWCLFFFFFPFPPGVSYYWRKTTKPLFTHDIGESLPTRRFGWDLHFLEEELLLFFFFPGHFIVVKSFHSINNYIMYCNNYNTPAPPL